MKIKFFLCLASAITFLTAALSINAAEQIVIVYTPGQDKNPTIKFNGISGNTEMSNLVPLYLKSCGWVDPVSSNAEFELKGAANSTTCEYVISIAGAEIKRGRISFTTAREGAQKLVDACLVAIFPKEKDLVKELCQSRIAFCVDVNPNKRDIYTCDIAGADIRQITNFNSLCVEPSWAPDSRSIGYTKYNRDSTDILQTRLNPLGTKKLTNLKGTNVGASFAPDFSRLAFVGSFQGQVDMYWQNIGSNSQTRLTNNTAVEASPCWSPSGDAICYTTNEGGRVPQLYILNLAAKSRSRIKTIGTEAATPDWSKTNKIVYSAKDGGQYKLATYDVNGVEPSTIIVPGGAGEWESPSWAPDGRMVVCARNVGGKTSLYVVDTKTGKDRQLLSLKGQKLTMPSWSSGAVR